MSVHFPVVKSIQFVERSCLFRNCEIALGVFVKCEPNCHFDGKNDKSLIKASYIKSILENYQAEQSEADDEFAHVVSSSSDVQIMNVIQRIDQFKSLPDGQLIDDFYVDLEN